MTEEVLCYRCEKPIPTRKDLVVALAGKEDLLPFHYRCYENAAAEKGKNFFEYPRVRLYDQSAQSEAKSGRSIVLILALLLGLSLLAGLILQIDFPTIGYILIGIGFVLFSAVYLTPYNSFDELKKKSFEMYESKLPE